LYIVSRTEKTNYKLPGNPLILMAER